MNNSNVYKLPVKFEYPPIEIGIMMVIKLAADPFTGELSISNYNFKRFIDCPNPVFKKTLNDLVESGHILRTIRPGQTNIYKLRSFQTNPVTGTNGRR